MDLVRRKKSIIDTMPGKEVGDLLGERTYFRNLTSKLVEGVVSRGDWFGFCTRVDKSQVDIFSITNNAGLKLGTTVINELPDEEGGYRLTLYRYLLNDYLCYCEIPTVVRQRDYSGFKDSYSKSLITANLFVIAEWLGISYAEAKMFYGSRIEDNDFSREDGMCPYVKLTESKDGTRKVSKPRKDLDLTTQGLRIVPLFAIKAGVDMLYKMCSSDYYDITFVKDSGQVRTLNVSFDYDKLSSIYDDKGLLLNAFEEQYKGDFLGSSSLSRGYIRAIEIGTCLRSSPVRSINLARILKVTKAKPDLTFISIDLGTVKSSFLNMLASKKVNYKELSDMLEIMQVGNGGIYNGSKISSYAELESWVESQELLLSTPFIKQLALFMIGNPVWFEGYTGESKSITYEEDADMFDDELDFDL